MIIVDTHAVIWLTQDKAQLSNAASLTLMEGRSVGELGIADMTLKEITLLVARRRVTVGTSLKDYLQFIESMFTVMPINGLIAERSMSFGPSCPSDLTDRLIGATAIVHGARLVTKDERIRASGEVNCIW